MYGILSSRGCHLIVPITLENLLPSVTKAVQYLGQDTSYYCMRLIADSQRLDNISYALVVLD